MLRRFTAVALIAFAGLLPDLSVPGMPVPGMPVPDGPAPEVPVPDLPVGGDVETDAVLPTPTAAGSIAGENARPGTTAWRSPELADFARRRAAQERARLTEPLATVRWRDAPVANPENALLGVMWDGQFAYGDSYPWIVRNSGHWIYQGTGLKDGDQIAGLVVYEYDKVFNNGKTPAGLTVLSNSPVVNAAKAPSVQNGTIYTGACYCSLGRLGAGHPTAGGMLLGQPRPGDRTGDFREELRQIFSLADREVVVAGTRRR